MGFSRSFLAMQLAAGISAAARGEPLAEPAPARSALEIPEDLREAVSQAEQRGRELYAHDQAAWHATDEVDPGARRWKRAIVGWITTPQPGAARPLVRFLSETSPGVFASRVDAIVGVTTTRVVEHDPPLALPEEEQALARGRSLAIRARKRQCTKSLNTVVLRDPSGEIHVYLLAASSDDDQLVLAGHDLARVSADGREILAWRPFSKSCGVAERKGETVGTLGVTHFLDPSPTELHVFTSLNYGIRLYVGTDRGIWAVDKGEIQLVKLRKESE